MSIIAKSWNSKFDVAVQDPVFRTRKLQTSLKWLVFNERNESFVLLNEEMRAKSLSNLVEVVYLLIAFCDGQITKMQTIFFVHLKLFSKFYSIFDTMNFFY